MKTVLTLIATTLLGITNAAAADTELWRLDCGTIEVRNLDSFNDSFDYGGQSRTMTDSCYLIRHETTYMLWDTGLPAALIGAVPDPKLPMAPALSVDIPTQLAKINIRPEQISILGISHNHFDHLGQAKTFPGATMMIGAADFDAMKKKPLPFGVDATFAAPWLEGKSKADPVAGDRDVFGDGSVTILAMPGHTPGETSLLVRLPQTGPVLLSGDVVHVAEQIANRGVPSFNASRADSLASMERLTKISASLGAKLIVQHDATHIGRLPTFPESAR